MTKEHKLTPTRKLTRNLIQKGTQEEDTNTKI